MGNPVRQPRRAPRIATPLRLAAAMGALALGLAPISAIAAEHGAVPLAAADAASDAGGADTPNPFADVPRDNWAYDAVQKLAADGILTGYPNQRFKGRQPMTRYEMAVLVNRAMVAVQSKMAASEQVDQANIDALRRLVDAFRSELKTLDKRVAAVEKQSAETTKQTLVNTDTLKAAQVHIQYWARPGTFFQSVGAVNGPTTRNGIAPGAPIPGGYGPAPLGSGLLGPVGSSAGGAQNSLQTGAYQHGTAWQDLRLVISGQTTNRLSYYVRLENAQRFEAANYQSNSTPAYCTTAAASTVTGVNGCSAGGFNTGNTPVRLNQAWVSYNSPSGIYAKVGRFQEDEGPYNIMSQTLGAFMNGVQLGYNNKRLATYVAYGTGDSALTNQALNNVGCAFDQKICVGSNQYQIIGKADYMVTRRTNFGLAYDYDAGAGSAFWNPAAGLCNPVAGAPAGTTGVTTSSTAVACPSGTALTSTAAGPVTGAYQTKTIPIATGGLYLTQLIGSKFKVTAEGTHRFGNDPFTGRSWSGADGLYAVVDYSTAGNFFLGPLFPALGPASHANVVELGYGSAGLNAQHPDIGYAALLGYQSFYYPSLTGMQYQYATFQHWFNRNVRAGLIYEHFGNQRGVQIPAGSLACPGCAVTTVNGNALFLETYFVL